MKKHCLAILICATLCGCGSTTTVTKEQGILLSRAAGAGSALVWARASTPQPALELQAETAYILQLVGTVSAGLATAGSSQSNLAPALRGIVDSDPHLNAEDKAAIDAGIGFLAVGAEAYLASNTNLAAVLDYMTYVGAYADGARSVLPAPAWPK